MTALPYTPEHLRAAADFLEQAGGYEEDTALVAAVAQLMSDQETPPAPGHNRPPALSLDKDELTFYLAGRVALVQPRYDELTAGFEKWSANYGKDGIPDDDVLGKVAVFENQVRGHIKEIDRLREADREPINAAGKQVQGTYKTLLDALERMADTLRASRTAFLQAKEAAERAERERKARETAAEAARLADEAAKKADQETIVAAIKADEAADEAARRATAIPADLTRHRTDVGVTSSLRRKLAFEVVNKAQVPVQYMQIVDAAVLAAARVEKDPVTSQPIPGVRFYWETQAR